VVAGNPEETGDYLNDPSYDRAKNIKWFLKKYLGNTWIGYNWHGVGISRGML
jgi:hypothetical protein